MTSIAPESLEPEDFNKVVPVPESYKMPEQLKDISQAQNVIASQEQFEEPEGEVVREKLQDSRTARRQAEEDKRKLLNRIQLLKLEEQRVFMII